MIPANASFWAIQVLNGAVFSMLLMLITLGLTIIFGILLVVNFAHGSLYMLGAYLAVTIIALTGNFWLGLLLAPLLVGGLGGALEYVTIRPMRRQPAILTLLLTFGISLILDESTQVIWGAAPYSIAAPSFLDGSVLLFGFNYPMYRLFIIAFGLVVVVSLSLFLERTDLGTVIRAASSDAEMLEVLGVNTSRLFVMVFALGSALAASSGVIAAPLLTVYPGMGINVIVDSFMVLVLGGLGSLRGTVVAALLVGQIKTLGAVFISEYASGLVFIVMAAVLLFRPRGILNLGRTDDGH